jgi:hypothetical protein
MNQYSKQEENPIMKIQAIILTFVLTLASSVTFAGAGHDHGHSHEPVTQQQAEQVASKVVSNLIRNGVIENSWDSIKVYKSEQKDFGGGPEWVVSYTNEAVTDPEKRTLYIFMTLAGEYLAANYTGN